MLITSMKRGKAIARGMGKDNPVLLPRHDCVVMGDSLKVATLNAVYFKINASLVLCSMALSGEITYLSEGEIELTKKSRLQ